MTADQDSTGSWNIETLRVHVLTLISEMNLRIEQRFSASQKAIDAALAAAKEAVMKAELAVEKRLEGQNEFRGTINDREKNLATKAEVNARFYGLEEKLTAYKEQNDEQKARIDGLLSERQGIKGGWGYAVGVIGFVLALLAAIVQFLP